MTVLSLESLADRINREHAAAMSSAESAISHARSAGKFLIEAQEQCEGKWLAWLSENCPQITERMAQRYMRVARHPEIEATSLREALLKLAAPRQPAHPTRVSGPQPHDSAKESAPKNEGPDVPPVEPPTPGIPGEPEYDPLEFASQDAEALALAERDWQERMDRVLAADDRLAAAAEEIKRQSLEISVLKLARDGFMDGKAEVERLLRKEQSKNAKLEKRLKALAA